MMTSQCGWTHMTVVRPVCRHQARGGLLALEGPSTLGHPFRSSDHSCLQVRRDLLMLTYSALAEVINHYVQMLFLHTNIVVLVTLLSVSGETGKNRPEYKDR